MTDPSRFTLKLGDLSFPLESGRTYVVGSDLACDIRIGHGSISQRHCQLAVGDALIVVTDLGSATGTIIDGQRIESVAWEPGHPLLLGEIQVSATRLGAPPPDKVPANKVFRRREESFAELMSDELKRAPWFALSAVIHGAVLLALVMLWPVPDLLTAKNLTIAMEEQDEDEDIDLDDEPPPMIDPEELPDEEVRDQPVVEMEPDQILVEAEDQDYEMGIDEGALLQTIRSGTGQDILKLGKGALSGGFKSTVGRLRKSGLEIVFVFDSTGSMGAVLQATKERIARMVEVLHALVPDSRIGIITYRDRGDSEAYLTRGVPLSRDVYRSVNFMQRIHAAGGADEPEAVLDGLKAAVKQKWQKNSRRLVILVGDAPPHKNTNSKIQGLVKRFTSNGRSFVHAFVTSPNGHGQMSKATQKAFKKIARAGKGQCLDFDDEAGILEAVLSLAFGRAYKRSLNEVYKLVDRRNEKISLLAKELVRKADREQMLKQFSRRPVRDDVVRAIIKARSLKVTMHLIDFLQMRSLPKEGRHAASYIVQRLLDLPAPPIDAERGTPISPRRYRRLKEQATRRLQ